jgi:transcriptional regulator with XRE-family HTH domain
MVNRLMRFADKVRGLLKAQRLSQSELAAMLGTSQPQVSRWLEGDTPPRWDYLLKMARALGVSADYLIDPALEEAPRPPELSEDERFVLQLYRDLGLTREDAARALAGTVRPVPEGKPGAPWVPGAVRDLTQGELARQRQRDRGRTPRRSPSSREPDRQDEGADPDHSPGRVR